MLLSSPDVLFQTGFGRQISLLRGRLDQSAQEMVTGRKSDAVRASQGSTGTLLEARAKIDGAEPERTRLAVFEGRYRTAASALRTIGELTGEAASTAKAAGDLTAGVDADRFAGIEARSALASVFGSLEASFGGRSLFGGDLGQGRVLADVSTLFSEVETALAGATDAASVAAAIDSFLAPGGGFDTLIYQGGDRTGAAEIDQGLRLEGVFTAASDPLKGLYKGLLMASFNDRVEASERSAFLLEAGDLINAARDELVAEEAGLGLSLGAIERAEERLERNLLTAEQTVERILGRDPFEAASETQSLEAKLQAAYTVTGRLSGLRLTNYLR
jgi:flagellar hook-associated protein 3 FlgL